MQGTFFDIPFDQLDDLTNRFSDTEISKILGVTISTVFLSRRRLGIPSFSQKTGCRKSRKSGKTLQPGEGVHHCTQEFLRRDYFDVIDTERKAYFLGLIATDGHISDKNKNCFMSIELQQPDSDVIKVLASELNFDGTFENLDRKDGRKSTGRIRVYSRDLVYALVGKGITFDTSNKGLYSLTPGHLRRHTIRGVVDGDGSITIQPDTKGFYICSASLSLLSTVKQWVAEELGIEATIREKPKPSGLAFYILTFKKREVVLRWLYSDCSIAIARKKEIATNWFSRF